MNIVPTVLMLMFSLQITNAQSESKIKNLKIDGYNASFSDNGESVIYKDSKDKISKKISLQDLGVVSSPDYNLTPPSAIEVSTSSDLRHIELISNGQIKRLQPLGEEDYINVALSPNEDKILFRATGEGSFISDLEGNILHELKDAEFPIWFSDSSVIYAIIEDDGYQYLSSKIVLYNLHSDKIKEVLNDPSLIPIFLDFDRRRKNLIFNTPDKKVYMVKVRV